MGNKHGKPGNKHVVSKRLLTEADTKNVENGALEQS